VRGEKTTQKPSSGETGFSNDREGRQHRKNIIKGKGPTVEKTKSRAGGAIKRREPMPKPWEQEEVLIQRNRGCCGGQRK